MSGYEATLTNGKEVYIPAWPASVALGNLAKAGEIIGTEYLIEISKLNLPLTMLAFTNTKDYKETAGLVKHFVCTARVDGKKIAENNFDIEFEGKLDEVAELFAHVLKAQYANFFALGLVKEASQES